MEENKINELMSASWHSKPEIMANATLSDITKGYLVAYRKAGEAQEIVSDCIAEQWGDNGVDWRVEELLDKLTDFQREILRLMMINIEVNLGLNTCTEI